MVNAFTKQLPRRDIKAPKSILISDIHFSISNLDLASKALTEAFEKGVELGIPVIIAGDLLDGKAIIRAECANRLLEIFSAYTYKIRIILLAGNHDMVSSMGHETALNFLDGYCMLVTQPIYDQDLECAFIPYQNDKEKIKAFLKNLPYSAKTLIMHQGVESAWLGHYVQDKTSLPKETFKNYRVISGHYHRRQHIHCGDSIHNEENIGLFTYLGSPYSMSFGEADDGYKGFSVLYEDGSLELIPLPLRRHIILDLDIDHAGEIQSVAQSFPEIRPEDLVWVRISGSQAQIEQYTKKFIGEKYVGHTNFKLEKIPIDSSISASQESIRDLSDAEILDKIIDSMPGADPINLKALWREVYETPKS